MNDEFGKIAIDYERTNQDPDLVFTDLNMPKYDGFYTITKIKEMNPDAKIIISIHA
jgi:two-component system chemotaxis response regulator CheY